MSSLQLLCLQTLSRNPTWKKKLRNLPSELTNIVFEFYTERFLIENEEDLVNNFIVPNLTKIKLRDYFITENSFKRIATQCNSLHSLECFYINASYCSTVLPVIGKTLKALHFTNCNGISNSLLDLISTNCSNLDTFFLEGCKDINEESIISIIKSNSQIKNISFHDTKIVSDVTINEMVNVLSSTLQIVDLSGCNKITDVGFKKLGECSKISGLFFTDCRVSDDTFASILENLTSLTSINIGNCSYLTSDSVELLKNLKYIDIHGLFHITKDSLISLISNNCDVVEVLNLSSLKEVDDELLELVSMSCNKLREIYLNQCVDITDESIAGLVSFLPIKVLQIKGCQYVSSELIKKLKLYIQITK